MAEKNIPEEDTCQVCRWLVTEGERELCGEGCPGELKKETTPDE